MRPLALLAGIAHVTIFGVLGFTDPLAGDGEVIPAARRGRSGVPLTNAVTGFRRAG